MRVIAICQCGGEINASLKEIIEEEEQQVGSVRCDSPECDVHVNVTARVRNEIMLEFLDRLERELFRLKHAGKDTFTDTREEIRILASMETVED